MAWPIPRDLLLSAPQVIWDWDSQEGEAKVKEYLDTLRLTEGRVVLMASAEEHARLFPNATWEKEPWYGTEYRVERFDDEFIEKVIFVSAPTGNSHLIFIHRPTP